MKKTIYLMFLLFFLNLSTVLAEEFSISIGEEIIYKNTQIKLISIGTLNSAVIKVNNEIEKISLDKEIIIKDLKFILLESEDDFIKINIEPAFECAINEDCNDKNPCTDNICTAYGECSFPKTTGCTIGDTCVPSGSFSSSDGNLLYCSNKFQWEKRKVFNAFCDDNYECISNICENSKCTKPKEVKEEKMAPIWLVIIFGLVLLLKGALLFASPRSVKNLAREFSYLKDSSYKIIGMFLIIIGIILIIWALA